MARSRRLKSLKIYVAGPYAPPKGTEIHDAARVAHKHTIRAIKAGIAIIEKGHSPFIPHLMHFVHLETRKSLPAEFYYSYDMVWLRHCDALLFIGRSKGALHELDWAKNQGKLIFRKIAKIPLASKKN